MKSALLFFSLAVSSFLWASTNWGAGPSSSIKMATTTSLENSGLLDRLVPAFERQQGIKVKVIPVGTGKALKLAENGDVDLVFVHAREAEEQFVARGFGVDRKEVMYNFFILLGPPDDPARIEGSPSILETFKKIAAKKAIFISRGDDSGTHQKERELWAQAGIKPGGNWYLEAGQGMGPTLIMAAQKSAYTLADEATFLAFRDKIRLVPLVSREPSLKNPYSVIAVNPARYKHVNYHGAIAFINWVTSAPGQEIIKGFKKDSQLLFYPR